MIKIVSSWRRCPKCQCVWYGAFGGLSACPAGGFHGYLDEGNKPVLAAETCNSGDPVPPGRQTGWHRCKKCEGLVFPAVAGVCPKGGDHDPFAETYAIDHSLSPTQGDFHHCTKCSTFYARDLTPSVCAAGGAHNPYVSSYSLLAGPWTEMLDVVYPMAGSNNIGYISSPDGGVPGLNSWQRQYFLQQTYAGGAISCANYILRFWFAHISNDGQNNLLLSSKPDAGVKNGVERGPQLTGVGIIGNPSPCEPAIVVFNDNLYIFYITWDSAGHGYGPLCYVKINVTDNNGSFTVSSPTIVSTMSFEGRVSAIVSGGTLFVSACQSDQAGYAPPRGFVFWTNNLTSWTSAMVTDAFFGPYETSLLTIPDGRVLLGYRGPYNRLYYAVVKSKNGSIAGTVPAGTELQFFNANGTEILFESPFSWLLVAAQNSVVVAWRGVNNQTRIMRIQPNFPDIVPPQPVIQEMVQGFVNAAGSTSLTLISTLPSAGN